MHFTLRSWKPDDFDSLVKYGNNPHIAQYLTDKFPNPYTPEKAKEFIAHWYSPAGRYLLQKC